MSQDDYLKELQSRERDKTNTGGMAFGRGAYQGSTLGWGDELEARFLGMVKPDSSYKKELDRIHGQIDSYKRTHPKTMLSGEIAGGAGSFLVPATTGARLLKGGSMLLKGGALMAEGATMSALQAWGDAREKGESGDDVLNGAVLGAIFVPLGGAAGRLAGNIVSPFAKWVNQNLGGQEAKAVINALKKHARDANVTMNEALKRIITEKIPLMDIHPSFAHLGKTIAVKWENTAGDTIRKGADANLTAQSKAIQKQANQDLIPEGLVSQDQMNGYNNFLDTFDEMVSNQAKKTSDKYDTALKGATPSNDLIESFNNMLEVNPQFIKKANNLLRSKLNLSYPPLKINKETGKLQNLMNQPLSMDIIEAVAQDVKDLTYKMKSSQTGRNIRKNQQEPVTEGINKETPGIIGARSANTATQIAKKVEKEIRGVLTKRSPDQFLTTYRGNLAKITNEADQKFLTQQYQIGLAREIRDSMNTVKGLNDLIDNFNKSDSTASIIFNKLYPNKSIATMIEKFEKAKSALTSKRIVAKRSDTEPNRQNIKNANTTPEDALTLGASLRSGGLSAGAFNISKKLLNFLKQEGFSEPEAKRMAEILTSRNAGNVENIYKSLISRPELLDSLLGGAFSNIGKSGVMETVTDNPEGQPAKGTLKGIDQLISLMR